MDFSWILQTATMIGIGLTGYFLKTTVTELKEQIKANSKKVSDVEDKLNYKLDELEKELDDLRSDLPFIYVTREDFIRAMNGVGTNFDKVGDKLDKIHNFLIERGK